MRIPSVPETVRLVSMNRLKDLAGFYGFVPNQEANGMPVWHFGKNWLFSDTEGNWLFSDEDDNIGKGKDFASPWVRFNFRPV
eukprot:gene16708-biopygen16525